MTALAWKINRLKLMGPAEVVWRVHQLARRKAAAMGLGLASYPPVPALDRFGAAFLAAPAEADSAALCMAADSLLAGRWNVFALEGAPLGFPPQWNRDPRTGTTAPMAPGPSIDYRDASLVGDIKYLWEPSRHLELVTLAQAWRCTGDRKYRDGARTLLISWLDQCPYPQGVHWASSLELGVRLLNWSAAWQLLAGSLDDDWRHRWLNAVYKHCHFISHHLSRHSSANNHLLGEYMGLYIASMQWPCWPESARWRAMAERGLVEQGLQQNWEDGVNKEQAIYYHHEVMDMMLLCQLAARANGGSFPAEWLARLERMAEFLAAIMDVGGNVPMIGDADDARMLRLDASAVAPYRSLLASAALLFERADFKAKAGVLDERNRWLFADAEARWAALPAPAADAREAPRIAFPQGGYYLLGKDFGTAQEVRIVVDCGALGYLSLAAHGHADALAFTLSMGGHEMLIDPGTYAYHTHRQWRNYFRSTAAHNTVQVDGLDQSEIGGNFMWLHKANAVALSHDATHFFEGKQDGYMRLRDPVMHRRIIRFDSKRNAVIVEDNLECFGEHEVALHWHFAEGCHAETVGQALNIAKRDKGLHMSCHFGSGPQLHCASTAPIAGWISRSFDCKSGITTAAWRGTIRGTSTIVTEITLLEGASS
ncbi:alginate lyase family protein [Duganella sp. Root1480D1]|uniref:alginate lyase family protein n=1 Tax=Duganella sp. Root1480D1 TaxID=1736471 RepID=UPI00070AAEBA|nr:alginate lyase family protein [Duganella sp. Root1480D1]KQZ43790.1 heparinase [Duganella sp. Root1480D1]